MLNKIRSEFKYLMLPLIEINDNLPFEGKIIDLGCGEGVISRYIALSKNREVIGIDLDSKRVPFSTSKNLIFKSGDITKLKLQKAKGFVLSDVLHHLPKNKQNKLLTKIYENLSKKGKLVIKEIDAQEFLRSNLSRFWDFVLYPHDKIAYRASSELKAFLEELGFTVSVSRPCRLFPGSTTLYICSKA